MGKVIIGIVGLIFVIILSGKVLPGVVDTTATEEYAEPYSVATGVGVTTATETLSYDSYYDDLTGLAVASDNGSDDPVVMTYDPDTDEVGVAGLAASDSRILTISYYREAGQQFYGFGPFIRLLPTIILLLGAVACIWAIYSGIKSRG